jgi:hypothetical protein
VGGLYKILVKNNLIIEEEEEDDMVFVLQQKRRTSTYKLALNKTHLHGTMDSRIYIIMLYS